MSASSSSTASPAFGTQGNLVLTAPIHVVNVGDVERAAAGAPPPPPPLETVNDLEAFSSSSGIGDAKAKLSRFLCQKKMLNTELMVHVKRISSSSTTSSESERYSCLRCTKEFDSLTPIQRHLVVNHNVPLPGLQILMCSNCGNKDVDREENMSETGPSKSCNVCKHRMSRMQD